MKITKLESKHYEGIKKVTKSLPDWFTKKAVEEEIPADIRIHRGFVAIEKEKVVGFITYTSDSSNGMMGILGWIGVHKEKRGQGIGKKLVDKIEKEFKKAGIKKMIVETVGWTKPKDECYGATRNFYKKVGFTKLYKKGEIIKSGKWTYQMYTYIKRN